MYRGDGLVAVFSFNKEWLWVVIFFSLMLREVERRIVEGHSSLSDRKYIHDVDILWEWDQWVEIQQWDD
jgi:hypothetical protein